jgi:hypothetical protein
MLLVLYLYRDISPSSLNLLRNSDASFQHDLAFRSSFQRKPKMAFTEEEIRQWHAEKQARERKPEPVFTSAPIATCVHCHLPFGVNGGVVTSEVAICDICLGD